MLLINKQGINLLLKYRGIELEEKDIHKIISMLNLLFEDRIKDREKHGSITGRVFYLEFQTSNA